MNRSPDNKVTRFQGVVPGILIAITLAGCTNKPVPTKNDLPIPELTGADGGLPSNTHLPGGVSDSECKIGYVQHTDEYIACLDLETGKILWTLPQKGRPVALVKNRLLVLGKGDFPYLMHVLEINTKLRIPVKSSEPIYFPNSVSVTTAYGKIFRSQTYLDGKKLYLVWKGGAFTRRPKSEWSDRGLVCIDIDSRKVEMLKWRNPLPFEPVLSQELQKIKSFPYTREINPGSETKPLILEGKLMALAIQGGEKEGQINLELHHYDLVTGKKDPPIPLMKGRNLWPLLSSDGKKLLLSQPLSPQDVPFGKYVRWVFDLKTGKQLAKVTLRGGIRGFNLVGDRFFSLIQEGNPRFLRINNVLDGKVIWERRVWSPPNLADKS